MSIRIRPRVREFTNQSEEIILKKFEESFSSGDYPFIGKVVQHHVFVKFKEEEKHFWSPELTLEVVRNYLQDDQYSDHKEPTLLRGYISPNPAIWTLFLFAYIGLSVIGLGFLVFGTSQAMLNQPTQMFWYALACAVLAIFVFIASQIGQRIAEDQTNILLMFVKKKLSKT